jgi:hypothetical protein
MHTQRRWEGMMMALSTRCADLILTLSCPSCNEALSKKGSWVRAVSYYTCEACKQRVRLTYDDKLKVLTDYEEQRAKSV